MTYTPDKKSFRKEPVPEQKNGIIFF